ncbi:MAG: ABC transporter permease subunit [Pseudomonadales bacterium]
MRFLSPANSAGLFAITAMLTVTAAAFYGLIGFNQQGADVTILSDPYFHSILLFSLEQALLSALLSVALAWPVARALYYVPSLPGNKWFLSLCLLCFVLPTLVLITGFVSLLGLSGSLTPFLPDDFSLYGLQGILLAHVYMNLPFAVRSLFLQMQSIPQSSWHLARQLKMGPLARLRHIEWPVLRPTLSLLFGFIAILCFNSFAVVLALGGGPQSTTLEVAIYQALKYDFNIPEALTLAWTQLLIAGAFFLLLYRSNQVTWLSKDSLIKVQLPNISPLKKHGFLLCYCCATVFMLAPLFALLPGVFAFQPKLGVMIDIASALGLTLALGSISAIAAIAICYAVLVPIRQATLLSRQRLAANLLWLSTHSLIAPAMVISVGLYILFLPHLDFDAWGLAFVVILNTLVVFPFAMQQLRPRLLQYDSDYAKLSRNLKLSPLRRLEIEWRYIRSAVLNAFALVLLLAMGDVALFSIFGGGDHKTLPWLIYQYAGSYRINEASLGSAILLIIYLVILLLLERAKDLAAHR